MEALILTLRLGMGGPAMADDDPVSHEPDRKTGEPAQAVLVAAPGRTVIAEDAVRQAVAAEGLHKPLLHCLACLVRTNAQTDVESRMVVQDGEGGAGTRFRVQRSLEVHLPELVGRRGLEALPVPLQAAGR